MVEGQNDRVSSVCADRSIFQPSSYSHNIARDKRIQFLMDGEHTLKLKRLPFSPKSYSKDNGVVNEQLP